MMRAEDIFRDEDDMHDVRHTEWSEDLAQVEAWHSEYSAEFDTMVSSLSAEIGPPIEQGDEPGPYEDLDHGIIRFAVFVFQGKRYLLGYGQHDRETPVYLSTYRLV